MWLDQYFSGKKPFVTPPIELEGTEFRKSVWSILQTIPYGETTTYGDIGKQIAQEQGKEILCSSRRGCRRAQSDFYHRSLSPCYWQ